MDKMWWSQSVRLRGVPLYTVTYNLNNISINMQELKQSVVVDLVKDTVHSLSLWIDFTVQLQTVIFLSAIEQLEPLVATAMIRVLYAVE